MSATWEGDSLRVEWSGPPGACLYYARPGHGVVWLTCEPGTVTLATGGGDASVSAEPGGRLFVALDTTDPPLASVIVPARVWRLWFPLAAAP